MTIRREDWVRVELDLGLRLPEFYKRFIDLHGSEIDSLAEQWVDAKVAECLARDEDPNSIQWTPTRALPFTSLDALIYYNRLVRSEPLGRDGIAWPENYFVIGVHLCHDYWCIRLDGRDEHVWNCWADSGSLDKAYESLDVLLDFLRDYPNNSDD
jgi:hypothetical protein